VHVAIVARQGLNLPLLLLPEHLQLQPLFFQFCKLARKLRIPSVQPLRFGRVELGRFEVGAPRDKFLLGGVWTSGALELSANATRFGEITIRNANPAQDQTFDAKWTLDLAATWRMDNWHFTLGGDNVLNEYPDENIFANSTGGQFPYASSASPFGFNGAFWYVRVAGRF
jgi:iron complex outermembrane recepter protein